MLVISMEQVFVERLLNGCIKQEAATGGLRSCKFFKKRLQHVQRRWFPVKFTNIFKKTYFEEHQWKAVSALHVDHLPYTQ